MAVNDWSQDYRDLVSRNLGLLTEAQQERLRQSRVAVLGMGGIGGVAFEVLVRSGVGRFAIVDKDVFEPTNLNRQILATRATLGRDKIDVACERAASIQPGVAIEIWDTVTEENVADILGGAAVAMQAIDQLRPCLIVSRKARELDIPLVEGWAIPVANVRTFTAQTPSLEEAYGLPTQGRPISEIDDAELKRLQGGLLLSLARIEGVAEFYDAETRQRALAGHITSFAPMVWLTAVMMALEAIKVLLGWGEVALAPAYGLYDPFHHRIPGWLPDTP